MVYLFLDYDEDEPEEWFVHRKNPLWTDCEMVEIELVRLKNLCPKLRDAKAAIYRTKNGWHLIIYASLSEEERDVLLSMTRCHQGFKYFTYLVGTATLRVSKKNNAPPPYLYKVVS